MKKSALRIYFKCTKEFFVVLKLDKLGVDYFLKVMYNFRKDSIDDPLGQKNRTFLNITHERGSFGCDLSEILYYDITPIDTTNKEE